ncbi:MAG: YceI-like domain protein [Steroidobacteraceae bacterium]|nr:YceI-like domain protein [Steroidobacteraceae bacterium]
MRKFPIALFALLFGCALPPKVPPVAAPSVAVAAPSGPYERYEVVASHVEIRAFRDGPMAQLGHNHLIISDALTGSIDLRDPVRDTRFTLELPLASLVVDDPALRSAAGTEFAKEVPQADREGTRHNMLGPSVLDAARQPVLRLTAESMDGGPAEFLARVRVGLRGEERIIDVPLSVQISDGTIGVHASFKLRHADLGLTPFAVALGALRVRDEIEIDCRIDAERARP